MIIEKSSFNAVMGAASLMDMESKGMETELLGHSSGNLAGKGSQSLRPW